MFVVGQGLRLCFAVRQDCRLGLMIGWAVGCAFLLGEVISWALFSSRASTGWALRLARVIVHVPWLDKARGYGQ